MKPSALPSDVSTDLLLLDMQVGASMDDMINVPKVVLSWPKLLLSRQKKILKKMLLERKAEKIKAKL